MKLTAEHCAVMKRQLPNPVETLTLHLPIGQHMHSQHTDFTENHDVDREFSDDSRSISTAFSAFNNSQIISVFSVVSPKAVRTQCWIKETIR